MAHNPQAPGYRVDLKLCAASGGAWIPYTSKNDLVSLWFAGCMAEGLSRQGAGCRIIRIQNGAEEIVAEIKETK